MPSAALPDEKAASLLPPDRPDQTFVTLSALRAGYIHLPEREFIEPNNPTAVHRAPSLAFYVFHPPTGSKLVYDLGIRRDIENYPPKVVRRCTTKDTAGGSRLLEVPIDVKESLENGGIAADDINVVVLSHLHYDHTGNPEQFPNAQFVVGPGSLALIEKGKSNPDNTWFTPCLLPSGQEQIEELPPIPSAKWKPLGLFPHAIDFFGDGSFYIINAPGHVDGHLNGMARISPSKFILLASDSCHFTGLLEGHCCIARFDNGEGIQSVHVDQEAAELHIQRLREMRDLSSGHLEVVLAHDGVWELQNTDKFLPRSF